MARWYAAASDTPILQRCGDGDTKRVLRRNELVLVNVRDVEVAPTRAEALPLADDEAALSRILGFVQVMQPTPGWCREGALRFVSPTKPPHATWYEVSGDASVAGRYYKCALDRYRGVAGYRKAGTRLALYRWKQKFWLLADLGAQGDAFGEETALYIIDAGRPPALVPPTTDAWPRGVPPSPFRSSSGVDRIRVCGPFDELATPFEEPRRSPWPPPPAVVEARVLPPAPRPAVDTDSRCCARPVCDSAVDEGDECVQEGDDFVIVTPPETPEDAAFVMIPRELEDRPARDGDATDAADDAPQRCKVS
ncbi:hypothetical protein M885DRAFT_508059 [Pelagophyceae sp. CCMP2097]|nr:hypothetical protein M885DRAFT_508059 [Pelagophyceae sp. CCMP2097]